MGGANVGRKVRTNVVVDEGLVRRVMDLYQLRTKREAIDFALRHMANLEERKRKTQALQGIGWEGDLEKMRRGKIEEL